MAKSAAKRATLLLGEGNVDIASERCSALEDMGFTCHIETDDASVKDKANAVQPDLILLGSFSGNTSLSIAKDLKATPETRDLPIFLIDADGSSESRSNAVSIPVADMLEDETSNALIELRTPALALLSTMRGELARLKETCAEFGLDLDIEPQDVATSSPKILLVSESSEYQADLYTSLLVSGHDATMEQSPYRAADILDAEPYEAVIVTATLYDDREKALYLCSHIRNNPKLFHLPLIVLRDKGVDPSETQLYRNGATVVLPNDRDVERLSCMISLHVQNRRERKSVGDPFYRFRAPQTVDPDLPGILSSAFIHAHLAREIKHAQTRGAPLAVATFSVPTIARIEKDHGKENALLLQQQITNWMSGMVRSRDLVGRLDESSYVLVMPNTDQQAANQVVFRIAGILQNSEFHLGEEVMEAIHILVDCIVAEASAGDTVATLLARTRSA